MYNWTTAAGAWRKSPTSGAAEEREQATAAKLKQLNSKVQAELDAAPPSTIFIVPAAAGSFLYHAKHV